MGDGFATVDKRNLKTTGMSESRNPTMTADYRLRHASTLQVMDLSPRVFCVYWDAALLFTIMQQQQQSNPYHCRIFTV